MPPSPRKKPTPADRASLADLLLEAQVDWVLAELSGERLTANIARDVDDVLEIAGTLVLNDVVDREAVKETARRIAAPILGSDLVTGMVGDTADSLYDLAAGEDYTLGEVIDRAPVAALIAKLLSMKQLQDRALDRLTESPMVATVTSRFVTKIITDFVAQNRARAEKVPGMSSLLSLGSGAVNRVRNVGDKHLDQFLGDAAGKGALYTLRRTNDTLRELVAEAPLLDAAMEMWDLHADERISNLRKYLTRADLREVALLVHEIVRTSADHEFTGHVIDAGVDVFFERYGTQDVASLLGELGLDRDGLVADLRTFAVPIVEAAKADGVLAAQVRRRLEPFFRSEAVVALLA